MSKKGTITAIGLDGKKSKEIAESLNVLLANYQVFYMNTRGFHWNIQGEKFFELHLKFEELYNDFQLKIDEIAERILTLGETPVHSYTGYLKLSGIKEVTETRDGKQCLSVILDSFKNVIILQREIMELTDAAGDEGTNALMSDYIREQEKLVWMFSAYLKS
jgi:starvation-inducible DNA-binding protein